MGLKPSDYLTVPLLSHEHARLHSIGERSYWKEKGIVPEDLIKAYLLSWMACRSFDCMKLVNFLDSTLDD
jgi:hypothetical protein